MANTTETVLNLLDLTADPDTTNGDNNAEEPLARSIPGTGKLRLNAGVLEQSLDGADWEALTAAASTSFGFLNVKDFGATGDGVTDDIAAFDAAIAAMSDPNSSTRGNTLIVPFGVYYVSRSIHLTRGMVLQGASGGVGANGGTKILVAAGNDAITVDYSHTSPDNGPGDRSVIQNLFIATTGKSGTAHGIRMHATAAVRDCVVFGFSGNGVHIVASFGGTGGDVFPSWAPNTAYRYGDSVFNDGSNWYVCKQAGISASSGGPTGTPLYNVPIADGTCIWGYASGSIADGWRLDNVVSGGNTLNGIYVSGADGNTGVATCCSCTSNGGFGIYDNSFLGCTWDGCQVATNGTGAYKSIQTNARSIFLGCYSETDQPPSIIVPPTQVYGGLHAAGIIGTSLNNVATGIANSDIIGTLRSGAGGIGIYNGTATTNGTDQVVLSARGGVLAVGDFLFIGASNTRVQIATISSNGLTLTVNDVSSIPAVPAVLPAAAGQTVYRPNKMKWSIGDFTSDSLIQYLYDNDGSTLDLKYYPPGNVLVDGFVQVFMHVLANANRGWGWGGTSDSAIGLVNGQFGRQLLPGTLFTYVDNGIINEGYRIIHSDTPSARTETGFQVGDIIFKKTPTASTSPGWMCVTAGRYGTYAEGRTATANGSAFVTLSAATTVLKVGDVLLINGITARVLSINTATTSPGATSILLMDAAITAGSGLAIAYVAPVLKTMPALGA